MRRIAAVERAKRFANGTWLYYGGFVQRVAECAGRKKAQMFKVAGAEVQTVGTCNGSKR